MNAIGEKLWDHWGVLRFGSRLVVRWPLLRNVLNLCLFEGVFYFAYRYGMSFSQACASPFWFPGSVLVCALLLTSPRNWWLFVLAPLPIRLFVAVPSGVPLWFLSITFVIDSANGVITAAVLRRFLRNPVRLETVRELAIYGLSAVVLVPAASAFAGAAARHALGHEYWPAWEQWFMGNALAHLVVTPAILYWVFGVSHHRQLLSRHQRLEAGLVAAGLVLTGYVAFNTESVRIGLGETRFYAPVPFLFWAAIRFGMIGASGGVIIIACFAVQAALGGRGLFAGLSPAGTSLALQNFLLLRVTPLYLVAILIEQKTNVELSLRESEERFRHMADTAPVLIWMSGPDKLCNFFNQSWLDFTGRGLEKELGDGWAEGVHPDDLAGCLKSYIEAFDARRPFTIEYRLRRHDGEYRWILDDGVPRFDSTENFLGYIGSAVDLTERKQSEERFRRVVEASPRGIILVNDQGRIILVNAETEGIFGYPRTELLGQTVDLLVPKRWHAQYQVLRDRFRKTPNMRMMRARRESAGLRKDGTEFPLEFGFSPVQGPEGNQILIAIEDITARKEAEAETLRQRNQLAHVARVSTMGQLASSLAHELNQPLGAILRNAEAAELLLLEPSPDLEEVRAILTDIRKDDQRAGDVIDRMRALMRRGEVRRLSVNLHLLTGEVLVLLRPDADSRRVRLVLEADATLPPVLGDWVQLQQVVLNLVLNAMEALKDNPPANRLVVVRTRPSGAMVEVAVSDNGHGIPADKLLRVFEPFFTSKPGGLGMGLSISRSIVEAHRGRLWAENNADGSGATFHFTLPVGAQEQGSLKNI
jgi:two-component system sensor kinase FixL